MRVPLSWLREYVDVDLSPEALAERLTLLGMEVQAIERRGADWDRIVVGELLAVEPHPGSDHLLVTAVRTRPGEPVLTILTGASNVAAGQRVPVAIPGAVLPGGRRIEVTTMVGRESQGMLCSGDELGLTIDADGILVLPHDAPVGAAMADVYGDVVLDVDVKPNRGDALSLLGLAREVAATTGARVRWPRIVLDEQGLVTAEHISVEVTDEHLCPRFVGRYVDALDIGPSPLQVQARLTAAGVRPVSNVVDVSNYVMLELGKPIHTFDAAAIADGHIVVRLARPGERLETLDHVARELSPDTLLIADSRCPLAIAGVMGGASSEVRDVTEAIVIESAVFDPVSIRRTARRYALRSEASLRFEKGQEFRLARVGADRVAQLIAAWAGGRVAPGRVDSAPVEPAPARVPFRPRRVAGLLGAPVERGEIRTLLARVEVETEPARPGDVVPVAAGMAGVVLDESTAPDALVAVIPTHRRDLEIEADIIEEVARVRGYELVPGRLPETRMPGYRPDPRKALDAIRDTLAGLGLHEVVTHALVSPADHERLSISADDATTIRVTNPVSAEHAQLRRSLLPGLVRVLVDNERQRRGDMALFELGHVHELKGGTPGERPMLGILLAGDQDGAAWNQPGRPADLWEARGLVAALCERIGAATPVASPPATVAPYEHPGRAAVLTLPNPSGDELELGRVFEPHPTYLEAANVRSTNVAVALIDLDALQSSIPVTRRYVPFPRVPAVERDLAIVIGPRCPAGDVERVLRDAAGQLLRGLRLFDLYAGPPLMEGERSLAFRLTLQATGRTLTDEEVGAAMHRVVDALELRLGARIRS
ncbi:MAG: phenylalanine--tRNA ligase subunit beta [Candidatus Limnocylindrales bacterium]